MKFLIAFFTIFVICSPAWAQYLKGRYIVELTDVQLTDASPAPGVANRFSSRTAVREAAMRQRTAVRARQALVRARVAEAGAQVLDSIDLVGNALFVRTDSAGAARLAALDGVRRVLPVRLFKRVLDHAVEVHRVTDVWARVGLDSAGQGIRIAIIDSGVDNGHPGLQDSSLAIPSGFPKLTLASDVALTNNKVIVARSYVNLLSSRDPDPSARDHIGHGTALAMIAAGATNTGPLGPITGVAPKAQIGSYKIFGSPGFNDSATDDAILKAIEDAVADGMDVLSMSFGSNITSRLEDDPEVRAIERAAAMGVITVAAAGNEGPDFGTLSSPGTAPSAITVGASVNSRRFAQSATVGGLQPVVAMNSSRPASGTLSGALLDAASLDASGQVCGALPGGSASGRIILILRGTCTFETKLINAARAGAIAALVYTDAERPDPIVMEVGTAALPAQMVSYADGIAIRQAIADSGDSQTTLDFRTHAVRVDPFRMSDFTSAGPSVDLGIKPEVAAVGTDFYTATQHFDRSGDMYNASGYTVVDGTSFSTPFVAGVAALLKASRPGLSVDQYRSLIINNAAVLPAFHAQVSGAGLVDAAAADRAGFTASPAVLGFGAADAKAASVTIANLTAADDTLTVSFEAKTGDATPFVEAPQVQISAGATVSFEVAWNIGGSLAPGTYEGYLNVQSIASGTTLRIPYWYAVKSEPVSITPLWIDDSPAAFAIDREAILLRVTDTSGVSLLDVTPDVSVVSGTATVAAVRSIDRDLPGVFAIDLRFSSVSQSSVIEIRAGKAVRQISIP